MELKRYQQKTLEVLTKFFQDARLIGAKRAFENNQDAEGYERPYSPLPNFEDVPYICLRLPTGGGKTLIGVKSIQIAAENFLEQEFPFVLWMMPTDAIRQQTQEVLKDSKKFYKKILYGAFNDRVNIFDVADFKNLRPYDLWRRLNICVATFQSFRVDQKTQESRKVYQADEQLGTCFEKIPRQDYFIKDDKKRYESFVNLLAYLRPLMIIDEAHNYKTDLSLEVMKILRPSAVIELTATPIKNPNVLVKVTAEELAAESMIKMPVIVGAVTASPEKTLDLAIQKRKLLEEVAEKENEYIRPITLYQAENVKGEYNVDYVKNYLIETAKIPAEQVAVATGEIRGLEGENLFSRDCPIRHVITVQALKEGWDCHFASIFCSLADTYSAKDAEQLLGRVLRMPYATKRKSPLLNKAYAFLLGNSWEETLGRLEKNLIDMGFERREVKKFLGKQQTLTFTRTFEFETEEPPDISKLYNFQLQMQIDVAKIDGGCKVTLKDVTEDDIEEIDALKHKVFKTPRDRANFIKAVNIRQKNAADNSPSARDVEFAIPQLCLNLDGEVISNFDSEDFLPDDWSLTGTGDYDLDISKGENDVTFIKISSVNDSLKVRYFIDNDEGLLAGKTNWTQEELITFFVRGFTNTRVTDEDFKTFSNRAVSRLINEKEISIEELVRRRIHIKNLIHRKVNGLIENAKEKFFKANLDAKSFTVDKNIKFVFDNNYYPIRKPYEGRTEFNKHFYPIVEDLNSEETLCATLIDTNENVETWIRNIEREPDYSFHLPTHKDNFYPDFVVKLKNGTYAAIEYKGSHLFTSDDSKEKRRIGEIWANSSGGRCKFLMALKHDERGRTLETQLREFFLL